MKKSDLKTGMLVKTRDGKYMVVMRDTPNGDIFARPYTEVGEQVSWGEMKSYDEKLKRKKGNSNKDIMKIYTYPTNMRACGVEIGLGINKRVLLWERPEPKEFVFLSQNTYVGESGEDVADAEGVVFDALTIDEAIATLKGMQHED